MAISDRIVPLCELLLGAAYADNELKDQEKDKVRELLEELASELPTEVEVRLASFDHKAWDMKEAAHAFSADSEDDRKKVLQLVAAVNDADEELDMSEDEYLRDLATALGLPTAALEGMTVEVETEELKPIFEKVRKGPPPPPKAKAKSVDIDMD
jgi:uncharacterized tellurite resistance protein B-like protein